MSKLLGIPLLASEHGGQIDQVNLLIHFIMLVLFVGWGAFLVYVLVRFRKSRNPTADYRGATGHTSSYLEVIVAIVEAVLLLGISIPFWAARIDTMPGPDSNPLHVRVVAQQFAWNIHYPGPDGVYGRTSVDLVNEQTNPIGLDPNDPNGKDDITTLNQLYLPVDRPTIIHLSTKDVIHCFSLTEFRVKQDMIPGMSIPVSFVPTMTTAVMREIEGDETRNFEIACAQLCGLAHYRMRGEVMIVQEEEFETWLAERLEEKREIEDGDYL
jgi:cytochrome c oxidase subunit 2